MQHVMINSTLSVQVPQKADGYVNIAADVAVDGAKVGGVGAVMAAGLILPIPIVLLKQTKKEEEEDLPLDEDESSWKVLNSADEIETHGFTRTLFQEQDDTSLYATTKVTMLKQYSPKGELTCLYQETHDGDFVLYERIKLEMTASGKSEWVHRIYDPTQDSKSMQYIPEDSADTLSGEGKPPAYQLYKIEGSAAEIGGEVRELNAFSDESREVVEATFSGPGIVKFTDPQIACLAVIETPGSVVVMASSKVKTVNSVILEAAVKVDSTCGSGSGSNVCSFSFNCD